MHRMYLGDVCFVGVTACQKKHVYVVATWQFQSPKYPYLRSITAPQQPTNHQSSFSASETRPSHRGVETRALLEFALARHCAQSDHKFISLFVCSLCPSIAHYVAIPPTQSACQSVSHRVNRCDSISFLETRWPCVKYSGS